MALLANSAFATPPSLIVIVPLASPKLSPLKVKVAPNAIAVLLEPSETVILLFDKELFPIFERVLLDPLIVLFVKVSVVARPTRVSVPVGRVIVPPLEILEIAGVVKVLFVNVSLPANVASVPVVGNVTLVVPVVVNVNA